MKGGMPCNQCAHPTCKYSFVKQAVMACPDCQAGTVTLDIVSAPKWRLDCNTCSYLVYLPPDLHQAKVTEDSCEVRMLDRLAYLMKPTLQMHVAVHHGAEHCRACLFASASSLATSCVKHWRF